MDAAVPYVELHAHSAFSFLDGASTPAELAAAAAELGYPALALTDHDGVWGSMEFAHACRGLGIRPITGAELTVAAMEPGRDRRPAESPAAGSLAHLTLLVESPAGYRNLCRLLTAAHSHTRDSTGRTATQPWVTLEQVEAHAEGLVCLSGCARDGALAGAWERRRRGAPAAAALGAAALLAAFGRDRFRVELQRPYWRHDRARNRWLAGLAERLGVPCVATGNVHSHTRCRARLQDVFVAVRLGTTLEASEPQRRGNPTSVLASPRAMAARFAEHPGAVAETLQLAERLRFDLTEELGYRYPGSEDPGADRELAEVCGVRLAERYAGSRRLREAGKRLEEELGTIRNLGLSGFFLLHRDLLELAREVAVEVRGPDSARSILPPGRGRGSSVSSIVCYLTGLSHVDPVKADLFSGRFLNDEIAAMPDIDLDFPRDIREVLIPRVHERYGADRSALVAAFPTYRPRGAVRDLGKALALPPAEIERVAKTVGFHERSGRDRARCRRRDRRPRAPPRRGWRALLAPLRRGDGPAPPRLPAPGRDGDLDPAADRRLPGRAGGDGGAADRPVGQGLLRRRRLPQDRPAGAGDALRGRALRRGSRRGRGASGSTSRASRSTTPRPSNRSAPPRRPASSRSRAAPRCRCCRAPSPANLDDLTVQVALVRPGPIQGGAVHPYIERRKRLREDPGFEIPYEHPLLEPVLERDAGHDRLPGAGDRGGDGAGRLQLRARRRGCGGR